jgi:DNA-binding transcriptional MerR regulator
MPKPGPGATAPAPVFASRDVCQIARVSPRQLQWWDERNILPAHQEGHRRVYLPEDVIGIMVIAELRRKGLSLQKIRRVVRGFQREVGRRLSEGSPGESELHVLTDGKSVHLEDRSARIIELLKKSSRPMLLVSVSDQVRRLARFGKTPEGRKRARRLEDQLTLF